MKSSLLSQVVLLPTVAFGLAVPRHSVYGVSKHGNLVAGPRESDGQSIFFSAPCHGCFDDDNDELEFKLTIEASDHACEPSAVLLNGIRLAGVATANARKGNLLLTSASLTPRETLSSWEMSCFEDEVALISVRIIPLPGQYEVAQPSGFAASFKQGSELKFLRLESTPVSDVNSVSIAQHWSDAQEHPGFVVVPSSTLDDQSFPSEVQQQLQKLYQMKATIGRMHHRYMRQEQHILDMIKQDFYACHGAQCLFQTAIKKAPDFFELVKAHFRHHPDLNKHHQHDLGFDEMHDFRVQPEEDSPFSHDELDEPFPFGQLQPHELPPPPPPQPFPGHEGPVSGDRPPPPPPPPHGYKGQPLFAWHHEPGHHRPHFWHRHGPHRHPFFFSLGSIFVFITVASVLFRVVRKKTGLFRNDRRRRDRAARREECRNRAAYRTAAMRHQCRRWWSQFRRSESTSDYEEKRSRILEQEGVLEDVMQSEIRDLRRAHEIVGDMMRADGERHRLYQQANFGNASHAVIPTSSSRPHERGDTDSMAGTLPLYQPPPPSYEQELEGDMMVVDGFTYTPSQTDSTAESSVVDCNSRISLDTSTTATKD